MKKELIKKQQLFFGMAVLGAFVLFLLGGGIAYAEPAYKVVEGRGQDGVSSNEGYMETMEGKAWIGAMLPGKGIQKDIPLNAETVTQIPRYITAGNIIYVLDESAIEIEETGYGSAEGADVVTVSEKFENLPDNDLARIRKDIAYDGVTCELLCVIYKITDWDDNGIPKEYEAVCEYGGLKKYEISYAEDWVAHVRYDAYTMAEQGIRSIFQYERGDREVLHVSRQTGIGQAGKEHPDEEERDVPTNRVLMRKLPHPEEKEEKWDFLVPLVIISLLAGIAGLLFALMSCLSSMSAPLFALTSAGKYRYIGQIRIREGEGGYSAYLKECHVARAELPSYRIRMPGKILRKMKTGMLKVKCPGGKMIMLIPGKEVFFLLEQS